MSDNILNVEATPNKTQDWEAADIVIQYNDRTETKRKSIRVTREEVVEEKREEYLRRPGVTEEALQGFDISVEQFQGLVYAAARQLAMSPLYLEDRDVFLSPMAVTEVQVLPIRKSKILTPNSGVVVPN
jgi:hypothetical protein